jgi:hypothetical protein
MKIRVLSQIFVAFVASSGCATSNFVARQAAEYNESVEWNTNVVLLANAVRASKRLPMHYTRLGSMTFSGSFNPSASIAGTLGNDTPENIPITLGIGASGGGNVNFESLSSERFYKAILAGIDPQTVKFYRDQGWPDELVMALFVERIVIREPIAKDLLHAAGIEEGVFEKKVMEAPSPSNRKADVEPFLGEVVIDNDPENPRRFIAFRNFAQFVTDNFEIELKSEDQGRRTIARLADLKDIGQPIFSPDDLKGASIKNGAIQVPNPPRTFVKFTARKPSVSGDAGFSRLQGLSKQLKSCISTPGGVATSTANGCNFEIVLRSPDGALYYLGELVRAQSRKDLILAYARECGKTDKSEPIIFGFNETCRTRPEILAGDDESLFFIESRQDKFLQRPAFRHERGLFDFKLQDRHYWVPRADQLRGRTLQLVALVNQLFAQRQERSEPPAITILQGVAN